MRKISPNIIVMDRGNDTTCTVNIHGATVVSWIINGEEQLFVSKLAIFNGRTPIRGGVTITFPHFGPWPFGPRHGFARIITWQLEKAPHKLKTDDIEVVFSLCESEFTKSMWNYKFRLMYTLVLHERELHSTISVQNTNKELPFRFKFGINHFLLVPDVVKCEVLGTEGCMYLNKNEGNDTKGKLEEPVKVTEFIDRIIVDVPNELYVTNTMSGHKFRIQTQNLPDLVIWNPWSEQSKSIKDLDDEEYKTLFYFAIGKVDKFVSLQPGETFEAKVILCNCKEVPVSI